jgi:glycosyltransferase involved in cell wall biosynthesis
MSDSAPDGHGDPPVARPLRILVAQNVPRARTGGMSRLMGFMHDRVAARGHTVDYLCAEELGGPSKRLARFTFPLLVLRPARAAARAGRSYDLINVHEPSAVAVLAGRRTVGDAVIVVTTHGVEQRGWKIRREAARRETDPIALRTRFIYPATILWQANFGLRQADHIFCLNQEDLEYLTTRFGRSRDDITRIFPGVDPIYASAAAYRDYRRASRMVFAGSWLPRKGTHDLIASFATLRQRYPQLELHVLGSGVADEVVLSAFPLESRAAVKCVHAVNDSAAAAAYADADIYVLPSRFEGTPLTLIEAMASGLPIVTTATSGMRDVIRDDENGRLVPPYSTGAIVQTVAALIEDAAQRERLGLTARDEVLTKYSWDQVAAPVWAIYERLCDSGRGALA